MQVQTVLLDIEEAPFDVEEQWLYSEPLPHD